MDQKKLDLKVQNYKYEFPPQPLRWGIVTAGNISHDFVNSLTTLEPGLHEVVAVAGRDLARTQRFADKFNITKAYGSYLELAQDPNVEVAYVGTITPNHLELSQMILEHGKHLLCEKPLTMNEKQTQKLISLAKEKGLFLMEAVWSRFFPQPMFEIKFKTEYLVKFCLLKLI